MINDTVENRIKYEEFILQITDNIPFPFKSIYEYSLIFKRYLNIKRTVEQRNFSEFESKVIDLIDLIEPACKIASLSHTYVMNEVVPSWIVSIPKREPEYIVSIKDITETFIYTPTLIFKALLINLNLSNESNIVALNAHETQDVETLYHILKEFPLRDLFAPYKLIKSVMLLESGINDILNRLPKRISHSYYMQDLLESLSPIYNLVPTNSEINKESYKAKIYELLTSVASDPSKLIRCLLIVMGFLVGRCYTELGSKDPISESMYQIFCASKVEELFTKYLSDGILVENLTNRLNTAINNIVGTTLFVEELEKDTADVKPEEISDAQSQETTIHLDFPTRLISKKLISPSSISAQEQESVLREIYDIYGGSFEDMSCEEFLYLFGAAFVKQPASYNPPYYWAGSASIMKALLRILYIKQPRILKELILHVSDKATGKKEHDWGRNKNRVAYRDIEANIIKIIHRVTGKTLKEL